MSEKFNWDLPPGEDRLYYVADQMFNLLNEILASNLLDDNKPYIEGIKAEIGALLDYIDNTDFFSFLYKNTDCENYVNSEEYKKHIVPDNLSLEEIRKWFFKNTEDTHDADA